MFQFIHEFSIYHTLITYYWTVALCHMNILSYGLISISLKWGISLFSLFSSLESLRKLIFSSKWFTNNSSISSWSSTLTLGTKSWIFLQLKQNRTLWSLSLVKVENDFFGKVYDRLVWRAPNLFGGKFFVSVKHWNLHVKIWFFLIANTLKM